MRCIHDDRLSLGLPLVNRGLAWLRFKKRSFRFLLRLLARLAPARLLRLAKRLQFTARVRDAKICLLRRWPHNNHIALGLLCLLGMSFWLLILLGD